MKYTVQKWYNALQWCKWATVQCSPWFQSMCASPALCCIRRLSLCLQASQETIIKHCDSKGVLFCQRTGWNQIYRQALQLGGDPVDIVRPAWLLLSAPALWFTLITKHFCIQSLNAWNFAARTKDKKKKLDISFPIMMTSLNQHICLLACGFYHSHRIFRDCHSSQKWMRQMALIQVLIVIGGHEHGVHGDGWHWQETGDGGHSFIHGYTWIFENCDAADLALGDPTCGIIQWLTFTQN